MIHSYHFIPLKGMNRRFENQPCNAIDKDKHNARSIYSSTKYHRIHKTVSQKTLKTAPATWRTKEPKATIETLVSCISNSIAVEPSFEHGYRCYLVKNVSRLQHYRTGARSVSDMVAMDVQRLMHREIFVKIQRRMEEIFPLVVARNTLP